MSKKAMKLALEALEMYCEHGAILRPLETRDAIKEALAKQEQGEQDNYQGSDAAKAAHMMDLYTALGVKWGEDPFAVIAKMRSIAETEKQERPTGPATSADRYFYDAGFEAGRLAGIKITLDEWAKSEPPVLAKQEQGEPQPTLYVKDIDGNFHLHKEKGHTENCAALGDDCCPENHLPPSRVGVGDDYSISEPAGYIDHADGQVVWKSTKPANGSLLYTTPQPKQEQGEPVAWANRNDLTNFDMKVRTNGGPLHTVPLYTTPQQHTWVGLTEQEAAECWSTSTVRTWQAIEAKLKEKNNA